MSDPSDRKARRRPVHGTMIGIIVLDTGFGRLPGDVANAETWDFPVQFRVVGGVRPQDVIDDDPAKVLPVFFEAIDDLVATGVDGIATSCGFLAAVHPQLKAHSPIPVATSSLMQIPLVQTLLPEGQTVGVLTYARVALRDAHFLNVGAPLGLPVGELPPDGVLRRSLKNDAPVMNRAAQEREVLETVGRMLAETPSIGAIVCECTNLPPYSAAIQREFGLSVYDVVTLVKWLHAGLKPRHFGA